MACNGCWHRLPESVHAGAGRQEAMRQAWRSRLSWDGVSVSLKAPAPCQVFFLPRLQVERSQKKAIAGGTGAR